VLTGVILGFAAAFFQALSYLSSRLFVARLQRSVGALLILSHVLMGLVSVLCLPLVLPQPLPAWRIFLGPLAACSLFYVAGQTALFLALKHSDASRVSPLLGIKLVVLAVITSIWMHQRYSASQWAAVFLAVAAAWLLNRSGGALRWQSIAWVLAACLGYSLSDLNIRRLVACFAELGLFRASLLSTLLCYAFLGVGCLPFLPLLRKQPRQAWLQAAPFAGAWLIAMLCLFACFGSIGVVFGNIVQSTRGLISIALGAAIAGAGLHDIEAHVDAAVQRRRILAALMMLAAIALFHLA